MNAKLEERLQYVKKILPAIAFLGLFGLGSFKVAGELIMQPKREQAIMAAYKSALKNYKPVHTIRMGEVVDGEVIDTVRETANLMTIYADIDGKQIPVPLGIKTEYLARYNGIPTEGKNGYNVGPEDVLEY